MPAQRRAELSLVADALEAAHRRLRGAGLDVFILSTCLRVEIAVASDQDLHPTLRALYGETDELLDLAKVRHDEDGFLHLCRVASGLESPIVGEVEVLGQFRSAVAAFRDAHTDSHRLRRILDGAVAVARAARRRTGISPRGSLAALAAREIRHHGRVAILGAGAMARAAAEALGDSDVSVFSRRALRVAGHDTRRWEDALEALATFPAVISTVPGNGAPFPVEAVSAALASRHQPLLLIDLGMPPGFTPAPDTPVVDYRTVDDVAARVDAPPSPEFQAAVTELAGKAWRRISTPDRANSVIAGMVDRAESAVAEEVIRFARRLEAADDPEAVLRQLARTVARRILHRPISYINDNALSEEALDVLADAFGVGP